MYEPPYHEVAALVFALLLYDYSPLLILPVALPQDKQVSSEIMSRRLAMVRPTSLGLKAGYQLETVSTS